METIDSTISKLRETLSDYIKSTYHISNKSLIKQREEILNKVGNIFQEGFIETTPR